MRSPAKLESGFTGVVKELGEADIREILRSALQ